MALALQIESKKVRGRQVENSVDDQLATAQAKLLLSANKDLVLARMPIEAFLLPFTSRRLANLTLDFRKTTLSDSIFSQFLHGLSLFEQIRILDLTNTGADFAQDTKKAALVE